MADYLSAIVALETVQVENRPVALKALEYWAKGACDTYGDARLRALAEATDLPVCAVNLRHFSGLRNTFLLGR